MDGIKKKIDQVIKLGLSDILKANKFKKSGRTWHKPVGENWLIVNVQASSGNHGSQGRFAVNLGVFNSAVYKLAQAHELKSLPTESHSTIRVRLGAPEGSDHWWEITDNTDLQAVANDVKEKMSNSGLQWLNKHSDINVLYERLGKQISKEGFALTLLVCDEQETSKRIKAAIERKPRTKAYFTEWAKRADVKL